MRVGRPMKGIVGRRDMRLRLRADGPLWYDIRTAWLSMAGRQKQCYDSMGALKLAVERTVQPTVSRWVRWVLGWHNVADRCNRIRLAPGRPQEWRAYVMLPAQLRESTCRARPPSLAPEVMEDEQVLGIVHDDRTSAVQLRPCSGLRGWPPATASWLPAERL